MIGVDGAAVITVKLLPLLDTPPTVTTTDPVVAPKGTGAVMLVADQLVGVAIVPLNVTALAPCDAPKFVPAIITAVPTAPEVGLVLVIVGVVPAAPEAARNDAIAADQTSDIFNVPPADMGPAVVWMRSSTASLAFDVAGTSCWMA
jgi:hypothetical protein